MNTKKDIVITDDLIKQTRRAYHKQWRDRNKDKIQNYNKDYWVKKAKEAMKGAGQDG